MSSWVKPVLVSAACLSMAAGIGKAGAQYRAEVDSLVKRLAQQKDDTNKVGTFVRLANLVGDYDVPKALSYEQQGYALSRKLQYASGLARTAYQLASAHAYLGEYPLADSFLTQAARYFVQIKDSFFLAAIDNERGDWSFMQGDYFNAGDYYTRAAERFDHNRDTANSLIAYQNLVAVLAETEDYSRAVAIGRKILPVAEKRKDSLQLGYTLQGLTTDLIYLGKPAEAAAYIPALLSFASTTADYNLASDSYSTVATYYYYVGQYAAALPYYELALKKAELLQNRFQLSNNHKSIGSTYLHLKQMSLAKEHLDLALALAAKTNNKRGQMNATLALSEYFGQMRDYGNAYLYLQRHLRLKDSMVDARTRNYARYLEAKYENEKKEKEILELRQAQQEKDFMLRRRNIYMAIALGLTVVLALIALLIRRNYRARQRLAEQQAKLSEEKIATMEKAQQVISLQAMINGQESERVRMARDLHDSLGGLFSTVKMHFSALRHEVAELQENDRYKRTVELVERASDELRKIAHDMMPEVLMKLGLVEALKDLCDDINAGRLLRITLQVYGMERPLGNPTDVMLYRIIQELVNNILKHSSATDAIIQFNRQGPRLTITVEDNGRGFDLHDAREKRNMGMDTVKSRVDYLKGQLNIESRKDLGTTVMIELLLDHD
ncbi:MAG TPA: sensor histidine kinase [Puia sp.]|nr:sensor histidine kinase [Puia sp.]